MERDLEAKVKSLVEFVNRRSFVTESTPETVIVNEWLPLYPRGICQDLFQFYLILVSKAVLAHCHCPCQLVFEQNQLFVALVEIVHIQRRKYQYVAKYHLIVLNRQFYVTKKLSHAQSKEILTIT